MNGGMLGLGPEVDLCLLEGELGLLRDHPPATR